jgi:hypothetical protein
MESESKKIVPAALALLLPFATCGVPWLLWDIFHPFVRFLVCPAVFFSPAPVGRLVGVVTTLVSAASVVYWFSPPQLFFAGKKFPKLCNTAPSPGATFCFTPSSATETARETI